MKAEKFVGNKFNRLEILEVFFNKDDRRTYAVCKCDCGNRVTTRFDGINREATKSCGCLSKENIKKIINYKDLTNLKFGRLKVIELLEEKKRTARVWLCECDCGNTKKVTTYDLTSRSVESCGCLLKESAARNGRSTRKEKGTSNFRTIFSNYKRGAAKRNLKFNLTEGQFKEIASRNCNYCGKEPSNIKTQKGTYGKYIYNGIDRVDNNVGYEIENCVPCCSICNRMKRNLTLDEFLSHIKRIYGHACLS